MVRYLRRAGLAVLIALPLTVILFDVPLDLLRFLFAGTIYTEQIVAPRRTQVCTASGISAQLPESASHVKCEGNSGSIQYVDGVLIYQIPGLYFPGPGFGWGHAPSFNNNVEGGNLELRNGWNWYTGVPRLTKPSSTQLRFFTRGHRSTAYIEGGTSGVFEGQDGSDAVIQHYSSRYYMTLPNGTLLTFYDFTVTPNEKRGQLETIVDINENTLTVTHDSSGRMSTVTDTGGRRWTYTYGSDAFNSGNLSLVKVEVDDDPHPVNTSWREIARMEFEYYHTSGGKYLSGSGAIGDLMRVKIVRDDEHDTATEKLVRHVSFRYHTSTLSHKLQYIFNPQGYHELDQVGDPLTISNSTTLDTHADYKFSYSNPSIYSNATSFVTSETIKGAGCGCAGSSNGQGTTTYAYSKNSSPPSVGTYNTGLVRVVQTNNDGTVINVEVNPTGGTTVKAIQAPNSGPEWISLSYYTSEGKLQNVYHPSTLHDDTYSPFSMDLSNVSTTTGLAETYTYDPSSGGLSSRRLRKGSTGEENWIESRTYAQHTSNTGPWFLDTVTRYPSVSTDGTDGETTVYAYTWQNVSGSNPFYAPASVTITHPAVERDVDGTADTRTTTYDNKGRVDSVTDEVEMVIDYEYLGAGSSRPYRITVDYGTGKLNLVTEHDLDDYERPILTQHPDGRVERIYRTHLTSSSTVDNQNAVTIIYPQFDAAEDYYPVSITIEDHADRTVVSAEGLPDTADDDVTDDYTESAAKIEDGFVGMLYKRTAFVYSGGNLTKKEVFTNGEGDWNNDSVKYITEYEYDDAGRRSRSFERIEAGTAAVGTITATTYTARGQVATSSIGTNDGTPSDMTVVEERYYDGNTSLTGNASGDGNLTLVRKFVSDEAWREFTHTYDWRNRLETTTGPESFFERLVYDNENRITERQRRLSDDFGDLLSLNETVYDERGRIQTETIKGNPLEGEGDLVTNYWYDDRGARVKVAQPGGLFKKWKYDGAGRVEKAFTSLQSGETAHTAADDVDGDTVVEQTNYTRDQVGRVRKTEVLERFAGSADTDELSDSAGSAEGYEALYWYDKIGRLEAAANYGTGSGDPEDPPPGESTDAVPASYYTRWLDPNGGSPRSIVDLMGPEGQSERRFYDNLGRLVLLIANVQDEVPGDSDDDRTVEIEYNAAFETNRTVWINSSSSRSTTRVYGVTKSSSAIASSHLLGEIDYPGEDDEVQFAYNAQQEVIEQTHVLDASPSIAVKHNYAYDNLGRVEADVASIIGSPDPPFDTTVTRLEWDYDGLGRIEAARSKNSVGTVLNEIELTYNTFGQVLTSHQDHTGEVDGNTPSVEYTWSAAAGDDGLSRLKTLTYPDGRKLHYVYDGEIESYIGRVTKIANDNGSGSPASTAIAEYGYQGLGRVVRRYNTEENPDLTIDYGYDSLGRLSTLGVQSSTTQSPTAINNITYAYNREHQVESSNEGVPSSRDETYTYDELHRLNSFKRGTMTGSTIPSPTATREWTLDLVGNWGENPDDRTHNISDEITAINGDVDDAPSYDLASNITKITATNPGSVARYFTYDAWYRLVKVEKDNGMGGKSNEAVYSIDALGQRISDSVAGRHYFYSAARQLLEERNGPETDAEIHYVWGTQYVDEILQRDRDNGGGSSLEERLSYVQDHNWNVIALVQGSTVRERYSYDPYGSPSAYDTSTGPWDNRVLFTGRLWSENTFSYDYRHKEYSPGLGRFLQRVSFSATHYFIERFVSTQRQFMQPYQGHHQENPVPHEDQGGEGPVVDMDRRRGWIAGCSARDDEYCDKWCKAQGNAFGACLYRFFFITQCGCVKDLAGDDVVYPEGNVGMAAKVILAGCQVKLALQIGDAILDAVLPGDAPAPGGGDPAPKDDGMVPDEGDDGGGCGGGGGDPPPEAGLAVDANLPGVGTLAVLPPGCPPERIAGLWPAVMKDGVVYVDHFHALANERALIDKVGEIVDFDGFVRLDECGEVIGADW